VLDLKVRISPEFLLNQADSLLADAIGSLHDAYNSAGSTSVGNDLGALAVLRVRTGTSAVAAMMPRCTQLTVSSMTLIGEGDDSLRK